ncbi:MAG: zinc-ribbon domain-containing protein [Coprococcus sp.]|nr:zinc-ribbon domain-containing protein [Coprococcus sp.]
MAKFCTKCGKELKDGVKFCPSCGAPVPNAGQGAQASSTTGSGQPPIGTSGQNLGSSGSWQTTGGTGSGNTSGNGAGNMLSSVSQSIKSSNLPLKPIAIGVAALVVIVIIFSFIFGGKGYEKPIKYLEDGINNADLETFLKAFDSDIADSYAYFGEDSFIDEMDDCSISLKIVDKERIDKDDLKETLKDDYGIKASTARKATDGYILEIEGEFTEDDDTDESEFEIVVIKIDGEWKIPTNFFF